MTAHILGVIPLAAAAWIDGRSRRIPDACTAGVLACALIDTALGGADIRRAVAGFLAVGFLMLLCAIILDGGDAIGGGDVKLCAALGALLGTAAGLAMIAAALAVMLVYAGVRRRGTVSFAPFLFPVYIFDLILELMSC